MSLNLDPAVEKLVRERADEEGVTVDTLLQRAFGGTEGDAAERHVRRLLAEWQAEDAASRPSPLGVRPTGTAVEMFEKWRRLDDQMTDEEREAEDRLWEEVLQGLEETRRALRMRPLFDRSVHTS